MGYSAMPIRSTLSSLDEGFIAHRLGDKVIFNDHECNLRLLCEVRELSHHPQSRIESSPCTADWLQTNSFSYSQSSDKPVQ